jgi:hypothetical protein
MRRRNDRGSAAFRPTWLASDRLPPRGTYRHGPDGPLLFRDDVAGSLQVWFPDFLEIKLKAGQEGIG